MGDAVGCVSQSSLDVRAGEARLGVEEFLDRCALSQLAQEELDGDPCPADHALAKHDLGIDLDAMASVHGRHLPES